MAAPRVLVRVSGARHLIRVSAAEAPRGFSDRAQSVVTGRLGRAVMAGRLGRALSL
ncbi:hypothetical protein [Brevibacterium daeguense]|uniref:hypothetical protein n=1 Tax=Brevibacterium daeguense TaxID=909936 RepID=UPI001F38C900|nr:hypothetical protein [Brevibacterium daeguense]